MAADKKEKDRDDAQDTSGAVPDIRIPAPVMQPDYATIFGLVLTFGLIVVAIFLGHSNASFFNVPALIMVVLGTITSTGISYTPHELANAWRIVSHSFVRPVRNQERLALSLMDVAVVARKGGCSLLRDTRRKPP